MPVMAATAGAYFAMVNLLRTAGRPRMWPSWYLLIPVGCFTLALVLTAVPLFRKRDQGNPLGDHGRSRTVTGGELTGRSHLELDSTADDLIADTKVSGNAYVKGRHRPRGSNRKGTKDT